MRECSIDNCPEPLYAKGYCNSHYQRLRKYGDPLGGRQIIKDPAEKIKHYSQVDSETGCWVWTGGPKVGYGLAHYEGRTIVAHRMSYLVFIGPIPDGLQVDHTCENIRCVNPDHLEAVTPKVNTQRARASRPPKTHCKRNHEFTPENTRVHTNSDGSKMRVCRACVTLRQRQRYAESTY